MDRRPERVYGVLVRDQRVFLTWHDGALGLPGGVFQPLADDRKGELKAYLADQLGIDARAIWAQGAFDYQHPAEAAPRFSGFYTVWDGFSFHDSRLTNAGDPGPHAIAAGAGIWLDADGVSDTGLPAPLKILLISVLNTQAVKTT